MATATATNWNYKVRDRSGNVQEGTLEAENRDAVAAKLQQMGYTPISIDKAGQGMQKEFSFGKQKVKLKDLAIFSRQFSVMINSGLSLMRALNILAEQTENPRLAEILAEIRSEIEQGKDLSTAIAAHDDVFPRLYIAMVRAGEAAGLLDQVLERVALTLESEVALKAKIKSAMTYPVIMFVMAIVLTAVMLIFIVPTFAGMFDQLGGNLPFPTKVLVIMSDFITSIFGLLTFVGLPMGIRYAMKQVKKSEKGQFTLDKIKLRLPVFGDLFHKIAMSRFARNLGTLLRAGVPILQALEITAETVDNGPIGEAVKDVQGAVRGGEPMAKPLFGHDVFPPMVVQMIAVGEETGAIDEMLMKIADFYDQEVESTTESLTSLMEPVMIVGLGALIGSMVVALYMPIFKIIDLVSAS